MLNASSYRDGVISVAGYYKAVTYLPSHTEKRDTLANAGGQDIFLINYNSNGQYLGSTRLGGSLDDEASSVSITTDGNTVLGTSFKSATINVPGIGSFTVYLANLSTTEDISNTTLLTLAYLIINWFYYTTHFVA